MDGLREIMVDLTTRYRPVTVRQVFYRMVSVGAIDKTENEYKSTVCRLLADLRRDGTIPYGYIADNTRWMRKPRTFDSLDDALSNTARTYRRSLWTDADCYIEVWLEKEALAGVLIDVTDPWDVPLMVTRGFPSLSFLHEAAQSVPTDRPTFVYYFGDWDPSGVAIAENVETQIREMADDGAEIHFERVAITLDQVAHWNLPTRPTKRTDSRARNFRGESIEVDAIDPDDLRSLTDAAIQRHVDGHHLDVVLAAEESEREILGRMARGEVA